MLTSNTGLWFVAATSLPGLVSEWEWSPWGLEVLLSPAPRFCPNPRMLYYVMYTCGICTKRETIKHAIYPTPGVESPEISECQPFRCQAIL